MLKKHIRGQREGGNGEVREVVQMGYTGVKRKARIVLCAIYETSPTKNERTNGAAGPC